jgi:hypothetical protein
VKRRKAEDRYFGAALLDEREGVRMFAGVLHVDSRRAKITFRIPVGERVADW